MLATALAFDDTEIGVMLDALTAQHLFERTTVIVSAKHGRSPTEPDALLRIPDGPIHAGLDAAWAASHPGAAALVASATDDDAMIMWLSDRPQAAAGFAKDYLLRHNGIGNDIVGAPRAYTGTGLRQVFAGRDAARYFGTAIGDSRVPDLYAIAQHRVVFNDKKANIAEHGGADPRLATSHLVVSAGEVGHGRSDRLKLLGLRPTELQAVRVERAQVLPLDGPDEAAARGDR